MTRAAEVAGRKGRSPDAAVEGSPCPTPSPPLRGPGAAVEAIEIIPMMPSPDARQTIEPLL
jgi:hypothetical protein